jgi:ribosomal protein S1
VVEAEITGITDFGVFVRFSQEGNTLDFVEGLIHISELDWQLIENPADVVKVGQTVKAKIISISDNKVSLSLKALKEDPWQGIEEKYKKGDVVKGKVTKFNPYGAFIQITPQIQGLCHISEFGTNTKMEEALQIDQTYKFQISSIEPKEHRMILKLEEK